MSTAGSRQRTSTLTPAAPAAKPSAAGAPDASQFASAVPRARQSTLAPSTDGSKAAGAPAAKAVPLIARTFSAQEILYLAFDLPPTFQKMQLLEALGKWRIEDFAQSSFRKHRRGTRVQHKFVPVENLTSFSTQPLKKPLLLAVPKALKTVGAQIFEFILEYSGVRPTQRAQGSIVRHIMHILRTGDPILVDEFFFQCIKQTINNRNLEILLRTWEIFLIGLTVFPATDVHYPWIRAHLATCTTDSDTRLACVATFAYIRLQTRHYIGVPLDYSANKSYLEQIPTEITGGTQAFGVSLYELMWCQKPSYPRLPIPLVLHRIVTLLQERNVFHTEDVFRIAGNENLIREILADVNRDLGVLARGDVHVLASLLKIWLKELPNPLVPVELLLSFQELAQQNKFLAFVERLPPVHQHTLTYVTGFLQEVVQHQDSTGLDKSDVATMFGPCFVNPARIAKKNPELVQSLTELSVAFCRRLLEARDASIIYPLNPAYLPSAAAPTRPKKDAEPAAEPQASPQPQAYGQQPQPSGKQPQAYGQEAGGAQQGYGDQRNSQAGQNTQGYYDDNGQWQPGMFDADGRWQSGYYDENGQWHPGYYDTDGQWIELP
jgi:hypothetical protein